MPLLPLPVNPDLVTQVEPPPRGKQWLRTGLVVVAFLCGLFGTAAVIYSRLPFLPVPVVKGKVDWLAQHGDEYDTLFIGSSRTISHIIPELFDQLMAEAGMPTHSFNLGIHGMRSPEDSYLLETVLARRRASLKFVIVEANAIDAQTEENVHGTLRNVYWHDWKRLLVVSRCILERKSTKMWLSLDLILWKPRAVQYTFNVSLTKMLSAGRGLQWIEAYLDKKERKPLKDVGKRGDGYMQYDTPLLKIDDSEWKSLKSKLKKPIILEYRDLASQGELQNKRRMVEAFGAEMITFIPPLSGGIFAPNPAIQPTLPCFDFAVPATYPELFARENRSDAGHLNQQGAELFTRRLVERIVALKRQQTCLVP